jgi:dCTP diphosphatase
MEDIINRLRLFAIERDWDKFHNPKNLVMALSGEVGELNDIFQWLTLDQSEKSNLSESQLKDIEEEVADVFLYLLRIADKLDINLEDVALKKLEINKEKYPISLAKGNAVKYNKR